MTVQNASQTSEIRRNEEVAINFFGEKYHEKGGEGCIVCGRKTGKDTQGVFIGGGGYYIVHPEDTDKEYKQDAGGWMGWFPVGAECIKIVPKEFRYATQIQDDGSIK